MTLNTYIVQLHIQTFFVQFCKLKQMQQTQNLKIFLDEKSALHKWHV